MPTDPSGTDTGWISKWAFQVGSLSADTTGREGMADGFVTNAKVADDTLTAAKLTGTALGTGVYGVSAYGASYYG